MKFHNLLLKYCHVLQPTNDGIVTNIECEKDNHFNYFFMQLGVCIKRFHSLIRPIIVIDRSFLKEKYQEILFMKAYKDVNDQIFSLAFRIYDNKNDDSQQWFM